MRAQYLRLLAVLLSNNIAFIGGRLAIVLGAAHLGASTFEIGIVVAIVSLPGTVISVWVGRLYDRGHGRMLLLAGSALTGAGLAAPAIHFSMASIYVTAAISGTGISIAQIGVQNLVGQYSTSENRTKNYSVLALVLASTLLVGPLVGGFSLDHLGDRGAFAVVAAFPIAGVLAVLIGRWPPAPGAAARAASSGTIASLLAVPAIRMLIMLEILFSLGWDILSFLVPLYGRDIGLSASVIGMISAASSLATLIVRAAVPWLARHLSTWQLLGIALASVGAGFIGMPFFTSVGMLTLCALAVGAGQGIGMPVAMTLIYENAPAGRAGEVIGLRMTVMRACHMVLPWASGVLGTAFTLAPVFWLVGGFMFVGTITAWRRHGATRGGGRE